MNLIALLPMKANSSRVPGKNFKPICGKPLFEWILETLLNARFVDQVVINTDARELLEDSAMISNSKVLLRDRPMALRGDEVSMNRVIEDDLAATNADHYLMTHTTNPAISGATLNQAYVTYMEGLQKGIDSVFSVNRHQTRFYAQDCKPINHDPNNLVPTQELEPWFEENSCFYMFSKASFAKQGARIGANPAMVETPRLESCDIDEWDDWHLAELILKRRNQ